MQNLFTDSRVVNHNEPISQIVKVLNKEDSYSFRNNDNLYSFIYGIVNTTRLSVTFLNEIETSMKKHKTNYKDIAKHENEIIRRIREKYFDDETRKNEFSIKNIKLTIIENISKLNESYELNKTKLNWKGLELFVKMYSLFYQELVSDETGKKMETNDVLDLFILAYVQPGDLYITEDYDWKKRINDAGMGHYLLNYSKTA